MFSELFLKLTAITKILHIRLNLVIFVDTPKKIAPVDGPRRSPRLNKQVMDVFLYEVVDGKISTSSRIIHNVSTRATIKELTNLIHGQICDDVIFVPTKGMYWLRKGSKQLVSMKSQEDFEAGKKEYAESNIRIACVTVQSDQSPSSGMSLSV